VISAPGIYDNIPAEVYHADPVIEPSLSSSIAKILCMDSPAHAYAAHPRFTPSVEDDAKLHFDVGTIAHALILEGSDVAHVMQARNKEGEIVTDYRTKAAKEERNRVRAAGKVPILQHQWEEVQAMTFATRERLRIHKQADDAFTNGKPEQVIVWQDEGIWCRSRIDWLHDSHLIIDDYKTTGITANPETFTRSIFSNGYDIQAAFYLRGLRAVFPEILRGRDPIFRFIVQETFSPYALSVISLGPDVMSIAEKKVQFAIELWKRCTTTNQWPAWPSSICYAELPPWEEERWLRKELAYAL
jgi:hypothetical protein